MVQEQVKIMKILIVDDDSSIRKLYTKVLNSNGVEVLASAKNGEEAIIKFRNLSQKPDIILMDYQMPVKNGIEAMREILEIDNKIKIIIMSADEGIKEEALLEGATCFVAKTFSLSKMIKDIADNFGKCNCPSFAA